MSKKTRFTRGIFSGWIVSSKEEGKKVHKSEGGRTLLLNKTALEEYGIVVV